MVYTCIYEALPNKLFTVTFIILSLLELTVLVYAIFNWKNNNSGGKFGMCLVAVLLFLVIGSTIYTYFSTKVLWQTYKDGNCVVTEGLIEDYTEETTEASELPDRFIVNDVEFIVSNSPSTGYGYPLRHRDGGLLQNGMYCRIYYIPYRFENIIMKIDVRF